MAIRCLNEKDTGAGLFTNAWRARLRQPSPEELRALALSQSNRFVNKPSHSLLTPPVYLSNVRSGERCGAWHSPYQISSFHPLETSKSQINTQLP
jgi:hypothetical protein